MLWFDKSSSEWVAFEDKCPHRLAPLSVTFSFPSFHAPILVQIEVILCLLAKKMEKEFFFFFFNEGNDIFEGHPLLGFGC